MRTRQITNNDHADVAREVVSRLRMLSRLLFDAAGSPSEWDEETLMEVSLAFEEQADKLAASLATLDEPATVSQSEGGAR